MSDWVANVGTCCEDLGLMAECPNEQTVYYGGNFSNPQQTLYYGSTSNYEQLGNNGGKQFSNYEDQSDNDGHHLDVGTELMNSQWMASSKLDCGFKCSVNDRLLQALSYMKGFVRDKEILVQLWLPIIKSGRNVLATVDQPYLISTSSESLMGYRNTCSTFMFLAEENSKEVIGFPGLTFLDKLPEWTPDVQLFKRNEYPLKDLANRYNIKGCCSLPIFDKRTKTCIGVLEAAMTSPKISYYRDIQDLCTALEAVDLDSSHDFCPPSFELNELHQTAIPEISEALRSICTAHNLPLALTWSPCCRQGKRGSSQFAEKFSSCISTVAAACYVADNSYLGFSVAAIEQYLFYGQGIVGRAFGTEKQCFDADVSSFSKSNYPLSHHATIFGLRAALAIPLRCIRSGLVEFVLEFFFPKGCLDQITQNQMCELLAVLVQQSCSSFQVVTQRDDFEQPSDIPCSNISDNKSWVFSIKGKCVDETPKQAFQLTDYKESSVQEYHNNLPLVRRAKTEKFVSLEVLRQYFGASLKDAAEGLGVCPTTLKKICRQHGITRWPCRKIKKVEHSLMKLQQVVCSVQGAQGNIQIGPLYSAFPGLNSSNSQPLDPAAKSSGSSTTRNPVPDCDADAGAVINGRCCNADAGAVINGRCCNADAQNGADQRGLKVKANFEGENVRLSFRLNWGFSNLKQQIGQRFGVGEDGIGLKYVDEDGEWVRLASDADLDECKSIHQHPKFGSIIRISVYRT